MAQCSAVSVCPFWTWCYELLHVPPIQLVHLRPQSSQQTTSQDSLHTQHAEPRGALRQLLTPLVVFIFQGLPRYHVRLRVASYESCRASRCTQATHESTLSPPHLMQQLLAFVHPLLKFEKHLWFLLGLHVNRSPCLGFNPTRQTHLEVVPF